jgi:hypothetical protein
MDVEALSDRLEIQHVLMNYFRGVDRFDRDLVRGLFFDDAHLTYRTHDGSVDGLVDSVLPHVHDRYERTMHNAGTVIIDLEGDSARTETYCIAYHMGNHESQADAEFLVVWSRYLDRFERRNGEWRIARRFVVYEWRRTDRSDQWGEIPADRRGRQWPDDLVYQASI